MKDTILEGKVRSGLQIASGLNPRPPEVVVNGRKMRLNNTIALQRSYFEMHIPDVAQFYNGTINLDISPRMFEIIQYDHEVSCRWHEHVEETFWFVKVCIIHKSTQHEGYIYYPCPSEVKSHKNDTVELLTEKIPSVRYGDPILVRIPPGKVKFF